MAQSDEGEKLTKKQAEAKWQEMQKDDKVLKTRGDNDRLFGSGQAEIH